MPEHSEKQIDIIATGVAKLHERFDEVDKRFDEVDKRFDEVDKRLDRHDQLFVKIVDRLDLIDGGIKDINLTVKSLVQMQAATDRELVDHEKRITVLEQA